MIQVKLAINLTRPVFITDENNTIRNFLTEHNVVCSDTATDFNLDGTTLNVGQGGLEKTFADYGFTNGSSCYLGVTEKKNNAGNA